MENKILDIRELITTYDGYIKLFEEEINSLIGLAVAHGYTGNETAYQQGIAFREKLSQLKESLLNEKNSIEEDDHVYTHLMLRTIEFTGFQKKVMELLDSNEIELLSYLPYPSCVRHTFLSTNSNYETPERDWLNAFADRIMEVEFPKYHMFIDNKIAIEFNVIPKDKNIKTSTMWFGYKDGTYSIGLSAENMDGMGSIKLSKK